MKKILLPLILLIAYSANSQVVKVVRYKIDNESIIQSGGDVYFDPSCITFTKALDSLEANKSYLYLWIEEESYHLDSLALKRAKGEKSALVVPDSFFEISNRWMRGEISFAKESITKTAYFRKLLYNARTFIASNDCSLAIPLLEKALVIAPDNLEAAELLVKCK